MWLWKKWDIWWQEKLICEQSGDTSFFQYLPYFPSWWLSSGQHDERKMLENIFDSEDPSITQNHEISTKLVKWYENKNSELSEPVSCGSAGTYWLFRSLSELKEQTNSNDQGHAKLFAATGHSNYAKTCHLYIQSVEKLKSINPSFPINFNLEIILFGAQDPTGLVYGRTFLLNKFWWNLWRENLVL